MHARKMLAQDTDHVAKPCCRFPDGRQRALAVFEQGRKPFEDEGACRPWGRRKEIELIKRCPAARHDGIGGGQAHGASSRNFISTE